MAARSTGLVPPPITCSLLLLLLIGTAISLPAAKKSVWQDAQGTIIKGTPVEVLGPFALFRDGPKRGSRVLLRGLLEEDCRRFFTATQERSELGPSFAEATGAITSLFDGRVNRVRDEKLVPADLSGRAEPELLSCSMVILTTVIVGAGSGTSSLFTTV